MGFTESQVQIGEARQLRGYQNDLRDQTAEIILPRSAVGSASNDIGFKLQSDGTYQVIISDYDRASGSASKNKTSAGCSGYNDQWLKKLNQRYAYNKVKEQLSEQGFFIEEEHEENGEIFIEVDAGQFGV